MSLWGNQLSGPTDPAKDAAWPDPPPRKGFFTDTSICIGCKACEVACKEWNMLPMDALGMTGTSYDNTTALGANTWRHVAFVEQGPEQIQRAREEGARLVDLGMPRLRSAVESPAIRPGSEGVDAVAGVQSGTAGPTPEVGEAAYAVQPEIPQVRWLMASDVCKHCTHAGCLDVCPTGALFRTEFGTVVVQDDVCNGCGYCVAACPFGVIERRKDPDMTGAQQPRQIGIANKCTLCYDRIGDGGTPACAQACPTTSIQYGDLDELRERARTRMETLHGQGFTEARLYGTDEEDGVGGTGSVFLLLDEPEVYGLPPDPVVTTKDLPDIFRKAGYAGLLMLAGAAAAFVGGRKQ
ncbi:4Fe-4S dicluster domain-containing protein [Ornithinimicrobium sp. Y1847]|uniref:4Fe-4S dicluster domain-containing protein n=1 Tax=unclassified Ornithinimicrobium TaxID=2615080 RepID=UPI003B6779A5